MIMVSCCYNSTKMIWGLLFVDEHYVHDGNDDDYDENDDYGDENDDDGLWTCFVSDGKSSRAGVPPCHIHTRN